MKEEGAQTIAPLEAYLVQETGHQEIGPRREEVSGAAQPEAASQAFRPPVRGRDRLI